MWCAVRALRVCRRLQPRDAGVVPVVEPVALLVVRGEPRAVEDEERLGEPAGGGHLREAGLVVRERRQGEVRRHHSVRVRPVVEEEDRLEDATSDALCAEYTRRVQVLIDTFAEDFITSAINAALLLEKAAR